MCVRTHFTWTWLCTRGKKRYKYCSFSHTNRSFCVLGHQCVVTMGNCLIWISLCMFFFPLIETVTYTCHYMTDRLERFDLKTSKLDLLKKKRHLVQSMKRQCRKAERMWRKTKLEIHYSIYKDSLHAFNVELATARQTFFSNLINSNLNNTRTLFATVERLTNPPSQIPSEMLSDSKCNEFASFFSEKISNIRKEIGTSSCNTEVTQIRPQSQKEVTMSVFETIDSKILEEIVQHLKSSTCYLDTLPTSFFKSVLNSLEADLLEVVNTSLLSGTFPNSLKTAVVKPLLKNHVEQL